jgi:hypothetical protein
LLLVAPAIARADDVPPPSITVKITHANDSVELVAAELYGDRSRAAFLFLENKLTRPRPLRLGERIKAPVNRVAVAQPGDTFASIAKAWLGDERRGELLAELNGMAPDADLPAGAVIQIPLTVTYTAVATESLASVAAGVLNDKGAADLERRWNFLPDKAELAKGDSIVLVAPGAKTVKPAAIDDDARARKDKREQTIAAAQKAIPSARVASQLGEYAQVVTLLGRLDTAYLDAGDAADVGILLGEAQVALGDAAKAGEAFKRVTARTPKRALRRYDTSPRILEVWQHAGGAVE